MARSYYDILQLQPDATAEQIKEAYRSLAWKAQSDGGQEALREINDAYATLSSPQRRAEYDQSLAAGGAANAEPQRPRYEAPRFESAAAEGPGFHPVLRLFGAIFEVSYFISRVRYWFIPINLLLGAAAVVGFFGTLSNYRSAPSQQVPYVTTLSSVVGGSESHSYITVTGRRSEEHWYSSTGDSPTIYYYALIAGNNVLIVKGKNLPASGSYTGQLKPFPVTLRTLVEEDAKDPQLPAGVKIGTVVYLDTDFTPTAQRTYLILLVLLGLAAPVLLVPPLLKYSIFSPRQGGAIAPPEQGTPWPVPVSATGRFVADDGSKSQETRFPAYLARTGVPEYPLEVRFERMLKGTRLASYTITIPAGSDVQWGYEYGGGVPLPTVSFGKLARVSVPTEADARAIAEQFAQGNLQG